MLDTLRATYVVAMTMRWRGWFGVHLGMVISLGALEVHAQETGGAVDATSGAELAPTDAAAPPAETEPGGATESVESTEPPAPESVPAEAVAPEAPEQESGASEQIMMESTYTEPVSDPPPPRPKGPYARGGINIGGSLGFITAIGASSRSWVILGLGAGYYIIDGLEARGDATFWIGDPFITTLTPGLRYVFHMVPVVQPYVGTFYRHYFVTGDLLDTDSVGARAGLNFQFTRGGYFGAGAVYEHFLDSNLFADADQVYPELTVALAF